MKIYTRTGDAGTTALFGGGRVSKDHPRIAAYGTVDEANSLIGLALADLHDEPDAETLAELLVQIQGELFELGADLATPADAKAAAPRVTEEHIDRLETAIDRLEADLAPLKQFILPGGTRAAATLHVARTVCRRAERYAVSAHEVSPLSPLALRYLNRLSDLLFVAARWANATAGRSDTVWHAPQPEQA